MTHRSHSYGSRSACPEWIEIWRPLKSSSSSAPARSDGQTCGVIALGVEDLSKLRFGGRLLGMSFAKCRSSGLT